MEDDQKKKCILKYSLVCLGVFVRQVLLVSLVRKESLVSPVTPDSQDQMDALDSPDHQVWVCTSEHTDTHVQKGVHKIVLIDF